MIHETTRLNLDDWIDANTTTLLTGKSVVKKGTMGE
jgi:hypothetical protein